MWWMIVVVCLLSFGWGFPTEFADHGNERAVITAQNVQLLKKVAQFEGSGSLDKPLWTPDGQYIYVTGSLGIWRFNSHDLTQAPVHFDQYFAPLALSSDNRTAAARDANGNGILWDMHTGDKLDMFHDQSKRLAWITDLAFSPDGTQLAIGLGGVTNIRPSGGITVWNIQTKEEVVSLYKEIDDPVHVVFSHDGSRLVAGGYIGLAVWDTLTWQKLSLMHGTSIDKLAIGVNNQWLAYWDWRGTNPILVDTTSPDTKSCPLKVDFNPFSSTRGDVAFSPIARNILAVSQRDMLSIWDVAACQLVRQVSTSIETIAYSPDASQIAGVDGERLALYDAATLDEKSQAIGFVGSLGNMAFSDESNLFLYERGTSVRVWNTDHFSEVAWITSPSDLDTVDQPFVRNHVVKRVWAKMEGGPPPYPLSGVGLNLDDCSTMMCSTTQHIIDLIAANSPANTPIHTYWQAHNYPVRLFSLSPDQHTFVSADDSSNSLGTTPVGAAHSIRAWDIATGQQVALPLETTQNITFYDLQFSPNGQFLAAAQDDFTTIWDAANWHQVTTIQLPRIQKGRFTAGSDVFVSKGWGDVKFWNARNGALLQAIKDHPIDDFSISPDGTLIAFKFSNGTLELWGVPD